MKKTIVLMLIVLVLGFGLFTFAESVGITHQGVQGTASAENQSTPFGPLVSGVGAVDASADALYVVH